MPESFARRKKPEGVDTRDAFLARLLSVAAWMERNRRLVLLAGLAVAGLAVAGVYYLGYRRSLDEQAAARLQQLRLLAESENPDLARDALATFLAQYGETRPADQARVLLAQLELARDSVEAAIRILQPLARQPGESPTGYAAADMLASAYEQADRPEDAVRTYESIARRSRFPFQRRRALADEARIHAGAGRLAEAERIYERLVAELREEEGDAAAAEASLYELRLGEVRAASMPGDAASADRAPTRAGEDPGEAAGHPGGPGDTAAAPTAPAPGS